MSGTQVLVELAPLRTTISLWFAQKEVHSEDLKQELHAQKGIPMDAMRVMLGSKLLDACFVPHAPQIVRVLCGHGLLGGKGGFGAMLRSQGKGSGRATTDFGACRDLSGRRLRHVNQEVAMKKWQEEEGVRAQRKRDGIDERELPPEDTPSGIAGWYLNTPTWAEGYGKKASSRLRRKRKTVMCTSWTQARARATPPADAPIWWGCPRGANCNFAHGETELRGEELTLYKKQQKEQKQLEKERALDEYVHPVAPAELENEVLDAFQMGLKRRAMLQANQAAQKAELQTKMTFVPGETKWGASAVASRAGSWLVPLHGNVHVHQTTKENNAQVEGRGTFGTATVFGCALQNGKWYYEVELVTDGVIQLGWADASFEADDDEGDGVGDHVASWAYDGCRQVKWTNGISENYGDKWKKGDIIGCWVDVDKGTIGFTHNGKDMGIAFGDVQASSTTDGLLGGLFPAFSLEANETIRINIGDHDFVHPHKTAKPILEALESIKSDKPGSEELPVVPAPAPSTTPVVEEAKVPKAENKQAPQQKPEEAPQPDAQVVTPVELEDLMKYDTVDALMALGMEKLKDELKNRGLKCGGTLAQRAERLFAVRGKSLDEIAGKLKAKP